MYNVDAWTDGEVEDFRRLPVEEVAEVKSNSNNEGVLKIDILG